MTTSNHITECDCGSTRFDAGPYSKHAEIPPGNKYIRRFTCLKCGFTWNEIDVLESPPDVLQLDIFNN